MSTNMNNRHGRLETGELNYSGSGRWYLISAEAIKENSFSQFQFENFNFSSTPALPPGWLCKVQTSLILLQANIGFVCFIYGLKILILFGRFEGLMGHTDSSVFIAGRKKKRARELWGV